MQKKKQFFSLALSIVLVVGMLGTIVFNNPQSASAKNYSSSFLKVSWKIISYLGNKWYNVAPIVSYGPNADTTSSGTKSFNSSTYGASIKHTINYQESEDMIDLYATTSVVNWPGKISIILTNPSGSDVVSKTVDATQHVFYHSSKLGTYTVRFVENKKQKWNTWIMYHHYENYDPKCYSSFPSNVYPDKVVCQTSIITTDSDGVEQNYAAEYINGIPYIIPSKQQIDSAKVSVSQKETKLSYADLEKQTYDKTLKTEVRNLRDYKAGDIVHFEDVIQSIEYDKDENATYLGFNNAEGEINEWPFKGDLTNQYKIGDKINLAFKVVDEVDNNTKYEVLDYVKYGYKYHSAPEITDFLEN